MVTMTMQELENCEWKKIDNSQAKRIMNACNDYGMKGIYDEISGICKTISLLIGLPYDEVFKTFKLRNGLFYHMLQIFQHEFMLYETADLTTALSYLVIPEISKESNVIECLKLFFSLSVDEKNNVMEGMRTYATTINWQKQSATAKQATPHMESPAF